MQRVVLLATVFSCRSGEPAAAPALADVGSQSAKTAAPGASPGSAAAHAGGAPSGKALSPTCMGSLAATEEITRFLTRVSTHGTRSDACADGEGHRLRIDEINVCPGGTVGGTKTFDASFRVTTFEDGNSGLLREDPQTPPPETSIQLARFVFRPAGSGFKLDTTVEVGGLYAEATSPISPHDGECYGPSQPFVPVVVELP